MKIMGDVIVSKRKVFVITILATVLIGGVATGFYFLGRTTVRCGDCHTTAAARSPVAETTGTPRHGTLTPTPRIASSQTQDGRLPRTIEPLVYNIELFPNIYGEDPTMFTFNGSMSLHFKCLADDGKVVMNINNINITSITVLRADLNIVIAITNYSVDTKWQFLTINLDKNLITGMEYVIEINYKGPLKTDFAGLYVSSFQRRTTDRYVAATQFSPTDARKAFPCLDEPDRKAQFDITIVRRNDYVSLSNMPIISERPRDSQFVADVYRRTPKMSTYLVAMVVGKLASKTVNARNGLNFTAWAGYENVEKTETALHVGAKALTFFEDFFGIEFPLPKQDILALPETAVGAMENWGLIIFNDARIFYNESEYSLLSLKSTVLTICHEVAHQWFGNLVTMNWWSDLMLKEGFAMYFENVATTHVYPKWKIEDEYPVNYMHVVFQMDGLLSSHPVYKTLYDTTQIRQVFDDISYRKGGCLIRMINFFLGDRDFQSGLKHYLFKHKYDSVDHDDLWTALEERRSQQIAASNITTRVNSATLTSTSTGMDHVKAIMDTWVLQMNYPVVTITQQGLGTLYVTQERFLNDGVTQQGDTMDSPFNYTWQIPITYTTSKDPRFDHDYNDILWMRGKQLYVIDRSLPDLHQHGNWLIANIKQWGYYRVNYDQTIWTNIIAQLKTNHRTIHAVNRAQIINDLFNFGNAKLVNFSFTLAALEYIKNEREYVPWLAANRVMMALDKLLKYTDIYPAFSLSIVNMTRSLFEDLRHHYGSLTLTQKLNYVQLHRMACYFEMQRCIDESASSYNDWANGIQILDTDLRSSIICTTVANGNSTVWDFVLYMYNTTLNVNEKNAYLNGLACTRNESLQNRLIALSMNTNVIQSSEAINVLTALARNRLGLDKVWKHVTDNWTKFMEIYSGSLFLLSRLVDAITEPFITRHQLQLVETFMNNTQDLGSASQAFDQAREEIKSNIQWLDEHLKVVEDWVNSTLIN